MISLRILHLVDVESIVPSKMDKKTIFDELNILVASVNGLHWFWISKVWNFASHALIKFIEGSFYAKIIKV